jgi:hypothetical protein
MHLGISEQGDMLYALGGLIGEVRIASVARPVAWITTEYNNQYSPATFYSVGAAEAVPSAGRGSIFVSGVFNSRVFGG